MKELIGHAHVAEYFSQVLGQGNIAHAYCFSGIAHVGKTYVAESLATKLLACSKEDLVTHADMVYIRQEKHQKTGKTKKYIDIAQIRELNTQVARSPALGKRRVVIINPADIINEAGFNALLKTVEEPRSQTHFFFLVENYDTVPKTIQSRCQHIYFSVPSHTDIAVLQEGETTEEWELKCKIARGLPGLLIAWKEKPEVYQEVKREVDRCEQLFFTCFDEKLRKVEDMFGDKTDHISTRKHLGEVIDIWQVVFRHIMKKNIGVHDGMRGLSRDIVCSPKIMKELLDMLDNTKDLLGKNIHPKALFEQLLLHIP